MLGPARGFLFLRDRPGRRRGRKRWFAYCGCPRQRDRQSNGRGCGRREKSLAPDSSSFVMTRDLWAILGIIIFAIVYEVDRKVGLLLFAVIVLAMLITYQGQKGGGFAYETPIPPTVH